MSFFRNTNRDVHIFLHFELRTSLPPEGTCVNKSPMRNRHHCSRCMVPLLSGGAIQSHQPFQKKSNSICSGFDLRTGFLREINAYTFFQSACSEYFCAMKSTVRQRQNDPEHADPIFRPFHLILRAFKTA